ncbi:MAG: DUF6320 domain-containing protein [Spirochaetes bacterium]|nr:DUF6320 domain-containing protein [Spirochaetota bacterium]
MNPYCSRCLVELEERVTRCPLCGRELTQEEIGTKDFPKYPEDNIDNSTEKSITFPIKRKIALEIISLLFGIALFITLSIDIKISGKISWSIYPLSSIVLSWCIIFLSLYVFTKPLLMITLQIIAMAAFLLIIDAVDGKLQWILEMGLPMIIWLTITISIIVFTCMKTKRKGANLAGFILLGIGIITIGLDGIINFYQYNRINISWSIIVFLSLLTPGLLTLYYHYRIKDYPISGRHFHF